MNRIHFTLKITLGFKKKKVNLLRVDESFKMQVKII